MEVIMNKRNLVEYDSLNIGECFVYNNELYMKTHEVDDGNCVCLNDGEYNYFCRKTRLEPVFAYVTVK